LKEEGARASSSSGKSTAGKIAESRTRDAAEAAFFSSSSKATPLWEMFCQRSGLVKEPIENADTLTKNASTLLLRSLMIL